LSSFDYGAKKTWPHKPPAALFSRFRLYCHSKVKPELQHSGTELARDLGLSHATAIVVGTVIGSGIFLVPSEMMQAAGSSKLVYLAWLVGGLLSFFGALVYAELGAMKPQAGGEYVYLRDAYGPLVGFLDAWTWFLVAKPASIATLATGTVRVLGSIAAFQFFSSQIPHYSITYGQLIAVGATWLITLLNYVGIKKAGDFQLLFTLVKVAIIVAIVGAGFSYSAGDFGNFGGTYAGASRGIAGFMAALVAALWAYDGWNNLNMVAGEVRNPERSLPIALIAGVIIVGCLYVSVNAAIQFVLPAAAIAESQRPASDAIALALGHVGAGVVSAGMALSMLVAMNGTVMSGGRMPFALARDGYFFKALAGVHPRFRTPSTALVLQAIFATILLLLGGSFRQFFSLAIFAEWLFYLLTVTALFILRWREPLAPRPYRVWGYPVVPLLFVMAASVLLYYTFRDNWPNSGYGLLVILAGVPVFYSFLATSHRVAPRNRKSPVADPETETTRD
jgi:APA family basic amino acid/polyamine antiporter